jgi:L-seryl-tRNA(Ser) seleniumtransferase
VRRRPPAAVDGKKLGAAARQFREPPFRRRVSIARPGDDIFLCGGVKHRGRRRLTATHRRDGVWRAIRRAAAAWGEIAAMNPASPARPGANADPFDALGVRSFINCCGSRTIYGGSRMPDAVISAMVAASQRFVNLPQLFEAAGRRIAELVGAPAALIASGGSGALFVGAAAAATLGDPERIAGLPRIDWPRRFIVTPRGSRFSYDHAMRATGLEIVEAGTRAEMADAMARAALVHVLGTADPTAPLKLEDCVELAGPHGVPVMVDAASEFLKRPDPYLARGASMVVYSGGKYLRGPQSTGLLIGEARWIAAAAMNASPRPGMGRHLKVSKEEIAGLVAAIELWATQRDPAREHAAWRAELAQLAAAAELCPGVSCEPIDWKGPEEPTPRLRVAWDRARIAIDGPELRRRLAAGEPAIQVDDRFAREASITILPLNLQPGEARIVGQRIAAELAAASGQRPEVPAIAATVDVAGGWRVTLHLAAGETEHGFDLHQDGAILSGHHRLASGASAPIEGRVEGDVVRLASEHRAGGGGLAYGFVGRLRDGALAGTAELGTTMPGDIVNLVNRRQYGEASWRAVRA